MVLAIDCRLIVGMFRDILGAGSSILVSLSRSRSSTRWLVILSTLRDTSAVMDTL
jgi:hypothetical protein